MSTTQQAPAPEAVQTEQAPATPAKTPHKITGKIVGMSVATGAPSTAAAMPVVSATPDSTASPQPDSESAAPPAAAQPALGATDTDTGAMSLAGTPAATEMHEGIARPERLMGETYKIKPPTEESAMYLTINDMVLGEGPTAVRRPFEIFVNSKNMDHFQWIVALTRIISAVFRKGGDVTFLVEELRSVFDPRGGYFKKGGKYMPSLVAEIGDAIEAHLRSIGLYDNELDPHQQALIAEKRAMYEARLEASAEPVAAAPTESAGAFKPLPGAQLCRKCNNVSAVVMDGCLTCLSCGDSKCG